MRTATETKIPQKYHHTEYIKRSTPLFSPLFNTKCDELPYYGLPVATFSTDRTKGMKTILLICHKKSHKKQKANKRNMTSD